MESTAIYRFFREFFRSFYLTRSAVSRTEHYLFLIYIYTTNYQSKLQFTTSIQNKKPTRSITVVDLRVQPFNIISILIFIIGTSSLITIFILSHFDIMHPSYGGYLTMGISLLAISGGVLMMGFRGITRKKSQMPYSKLIRGEYIEIEPSLGEKIMMPSSLLIMGVGVIYGICYSAWISRNVMFSSLDQMYKAYINAGIAMLISAIPLILMQAHSEKNITTGMLAPALLAITLANFLVNAVPISDGTILGIASEASVCGGFVVIFAVVLSFLFNSIGRAYLTASDGDRKFTLQGSQIQLIYSNS